MPPAAWSASVSAPRRRATTSSPPPPRRWPRWCAAARPWRRGRWARWPPWIRCSARPKRPLRRYPPSCSPWLRADTCCRVFAPSWPPPGTVMPARRSTLSSPSAMPRDTFSPPAPPSPSRPPPRTTIRRERMQSRLEIRRGVYHDSVVLMRATSRLRGLDGIDECLVAMATPLNIGLLRDLGFDDAEAGAASTTDLVVAVRGQSDDAIERALAALDAELSAPSAESGGAVEAPASLRAAVRQSEADLVIVSVPGPHAVPEAVDALLEGADVMVFSDGVSLDAERRLKALAESRGRLVMGPDCGTARLGGVGLGFCNNLAGGEVGIVAASGTGAQHVACLLEGRDIGVGHIIGVGGRDMSDDIGGVSALRALAMLEADPATG